MIVAKLPLPRLSRDEKRQTLLDGGLGSFQNFFACLCKPLDGGKDALLVTCMKPLHPAEETRTC